MHPAYHNLANCQIFVKDDGDDWLMCCDKGRQRYRVRVSKQLVAQDDISAHAATTFAAILPKEKARG